MGAPMLKIKKELHYRRGYTWGSCSDCNHYKGDVNEGRCAVIGLSARSIGRERPPMSAFRVLPHYICDRFDNSKKLERLGVPDFLKRLEAEA